ncbi:hypothetical protein KEM52_002436, partial [Ascosphaera acerosa]
AWNFSAFPHLFQFVLYLSTSALSTRAENHKHDGSPVTASPHLTSDGGVSLVKSPRGAGTPHDEVVAVAKARATRVDSATCLPGDDDPFFVADLGEVLRLYKRWVANLPRVLPFYAVKCNPDKAILSLLRSLGAGFDCASQHEVDLALATGVDPSRIIYAQPCKAIPALRHVSGKGVKQMTFDNTDELYKIKHVCADAALIMRIMTDDSAAACQLSVKFGAAMASVPALLKTAKDLGLAVVGVSFHVGSGAADPEAFVKAIQDAQAVIAQAAAIGHRLAIVDIGGGFCADSFNRFAGVVRSALDHYFADTVQVIAEPGRYFVATALTLAVNVIARRLPAAVEPPVAWSQQHESAGAAAVPTMLYINDGVYGNFSNIVFDHQKPVPQVLIAAADSGTSRHEHEQGRDPDGGDVSARSYRYSIWGPTCDGIDLVCSDVALPARVSVGDWLYFANMGAYTSCSATRFNGFSNTHEVLYICTEDLGGQQSAGEWEAACADTAAVASQGRVEGGAVHVPMTMLA